MRSMPATWMILLALASGCGDPLTGHEFRGEPLFRFRGQVVNYEQIEGGHELRVSLFWSMTGQIPLDPGHLDEQPAASVSVQFPSTFEINIFYPPENAVFTETGPRYALALILIYEDRDNDGRFRRGEDGLVGGALDRILLYAPEALTPEDSPTGMAQPKGFSMVPVPLPCGQQLPENPGGTDCGVPLGAPCALNRDCGTGGTCLQSLMGYTFPEGSCALDFQAEGCVPRQGIVIENGRFLFLRSCVESEDCRHDGFECRDLGDPDWGACNTCIPQGLSLALQELDPYSVCFSPYTTVDASSGGRLGLPCSTDLECVDPKLQGTCLQVMAGQPVAGGVCVLEDSFEIWPKDSVSVWIPSGLWLSRCDSGSDCRAGYTCDPFFRACWPDQPVRLEIFSSFRLDLDIPTLCY